MNTNKYKNSVLTAQPIKDTKEKFQEWENMLVGKDMHSIRNQIYDMIWDCAFFQCINESRRYAAKNNKDEIRQNRMIHYFINKSFFKTQLLSIRRLTDKDFDKIRKGKQYTVYSLYNLIEDIKKNSAILTRKNILDAHNLPYDYEEVMECLRQNTPKTKKGNIQIQTFSGRNVDEIEFSKDFHRRIDSITGITANKRSPDDLIPDNILQFDDKWASIKGLCKYVDKYIAHSATPESRKVIPDEIEGALGKVLNAHKIICETASFIGNKILFCGFGEFLGLPLYGKFDQSDLFEYLDEPIASKETIEKLREFWEKYRIETNQWNNWWCK
jgi:hypothetical protein